MEESPRSGCHLADKSNLTQTTWNGVYTQGGLGFGVCAGHIQTYPSANQPRLLKSTRVLTFERWHTTHCWDLRVRQKKRTVNDYAAQQPQTRSITSRASLAAIGLWANGRWGGIGVRWGGAGAPPSVTYAFAAKSAMPLFEFTRICFSL